MGDDEQRAVGPTPEESPWTGPRHRSNTGRGRPRPRRRRPPATEPAAEATERAPDAPTAPTRKPSARRASTGDAATVDAATGGAAAEAGRVDAASAGPASAGAARVDAAAVDPASADLTTADTTTADKATAEKDTVDEATVDRATVDKATIGAATRDSAAGESAPGDSASGDEADRLRKIGEATPSAPGPAAVEAPVTARARVTPGSPPAARTPTAPPSVPPVGRVPATTSAPPARRTRAVGKAAVPAVAVPTVPNPRVPIDSAAPAAEEHTWLDEEAGPVVRPYTLTGGRSRPFTSGLNMLTYVEALYAPDADLVGLQPEQRAILEMTRTATTVAELAARLDLPVGVVRVLVGDLIQANLVSTFEADAAVRAPGDDILQAVIDGLRAL